MIGEYPPREAAMSESELLIPVEGPPTVVLERRRSVRTACHLMAVFEPLGDDIEVGQPATVVNISTGGIALHTGCRLQRGLLLFVEFANASNTRSRKMMVRVIHGRPVKISGGWIVGCAFAHPLTEFEIAEFLD